MSNLIFLNTVTKFPLTIFGILLIIYYNSPHPFHLYHPTSVSNVSFNQINRVVRPSLQMVEKQHSFLLSTQNTHPPPSLPPHRLNRTCFQNEL